MIETVGTRDTEQTCLSLKLSLQTSKPHQPGVNFLGTQFTEDQVACPLACILFEKCVYLIDPYWSFYLFVSLESPHQDIFNSWVQQFHRGALVPSLPLACSRLELASSSGKNRFRNDLPVEQFFHTAIPSFHFLWKVLKCNQPDFWDV